MLRLIVKSTKNIYFHNLQHYRFHSHKRNVKKSINSVRWSIYGSYSPYSSVNAVLHVPSPSVAFNCGEGISRLINAGSLPSIRNIFITRLDWRCVAGLHGALLMGHLSRRQPATVFGPSTLNHLCEKILFDLPKEKLDLIPVDCSNGHVFTDQGFHIRAIPLRNPLEKYAKVIAYAGEVDAGRMGLNIEKCVDLNVSTMALISQLREGLEVTLEDGTVVRPRDVINFFPKLKFLGIIRTKSDNIRPHANDCISISVIDIPNVDYLHHLENSETILNAEEAEYTVIHFAPPNLIASDEYQKYMRKFPPETLHMTINNKFT